MCHDELRRTHRRWMNGSSSTDAGQFLDEMASEAPGPATLLADREVAEAVGRALLDLSESHRDVLGLRH